MIRIKNTAIVMSMTALILAGCGGDDDDSNAEPIEITILHMNDHHSHLSAEDFDFDTSSLNLSTTVEGGAAVEEVEVTYGGFPMMVSLFESLEAESENVLKLHAGDAITGTLFYSLFEGEADAAMMNQICFDAFALGNHEFDDGDAGLAEFLGDLDTADCDTPVLAANVVPGENSAIADGFIEPYTIIERDGQEIGIIGIDIANKTKNSSSPDEDTQFLDETATAQENIDILEDMGVNKIILLTHFQYANDLVLAQALTGVDVIVGGDSHTLLGGENLETLGFSPSADYPTQVTNLDGEPVCVVQAWEYAHILGKLDVSFDENGVVTSCSGQPYMPIANNFVYEFNDDEDLSLEGSDQQAVLDALTAFPELVFTEADVATTELLAGFNSQVETLQERVIGSANEDLCLERFPGQGRSSIEGCSEDTYAQGSDISNIVAKAFLTVTPTADIAIQNGGGVRVDVRAGEYTIADAFTLLPFSNTLVVLDLTGQQILDVLEEALAFGLDPEGSTGAYPYASGLRYDVNASLTEGSRFSNVQVNSRLEGDWFDIDPTATYKVVTNNFIAAGRDGYATFGVVFNAGNFEDTFTEYAQGFINYVEGLTESNEQLQRLPAEEYSTQSYVDSGGCDHSASDDCAGDGNL